MDNEKRAVFLTVVTGRKEKDEILSLLRKADVNLISIMYGRGAVKGSFLSSMFGLLPEKQKVVISCVATSNKADIAMQTLIEDFNFDKPNTGIAFCIPIEAVSY